MLVETRDNLWQLYHLVMSKETENVQITPIQEMMASCAGAFLTSITMTPFDVVKIRLQAQQKRFLNNKCFLYCNGLMDHICTCYNGNSTGMVQWYKRNSHFSSTTDAFIKITKYEGITSLWSGLPPTLVMALPTTVIYFTSYEHLKRVLYKYHNEYKSHYSFMNDETVKTFIPMVAGSTARTWAVTTFSPLEMVRTKMQSQKMTYLDVGKAIKLLSQTEGIRGLWKGLIPTLLRDVPFSALYWGNYEYLKRKLGSEKPTFMFTFLAGATSGMIAAILTLPFDVVKTHRQIELGDRLVNGGSSPVRPIKSIYRSIYVQQGLKGFFAGLTPRVIKVAPACAIMISSYELSKALFMQQSEKDSSKEH